MFEKASRKDNHQAWIDQIAEWKKKYPMSYKDSNRIKPQYVVEQIYEVTKGDAIIVTEVGQSQMWAAQFFKYTKPRTWISSGGLGTMGYGLPAANGAQLGQPDKLVFNIAGDGSIQMNIQELTTAVNNKLPIKIVVLDNCFLGMVRQWQEVIHDKRYSSTDLKDNPDLIKVAEAYGAKGILVTKKEDVKKAIEESLTIKDKPTFIVVKVEREENVLPFVLPGQPINKMLLD